MVNEIHTNWFNDVFWEKYKQLVKTPFPTKYKQGSKGEALKKIITLKPNDDLKQRIELAIDAQIKHRKQVFDVCGSMGRYIEKTKFDKFYANRMASTFINQLGWEDEFPDTMSDDVAIVDFDNVEPIGKECAHDGCTDVVHGPRYYFCTEHLGRNNNDELKQTLRDSGLAKQSDETVFDWQMRCKANFFEALGKLNA